MQLNGDPALSLKDEETDRLARAVASLTGESLTQAVRTALAERLMQIGAHCAALPDLDPRSPDEIVGYDDTGMWLMVVDRSAIVAILFQEPDCGHHAQPIAEHSSYGARCGSFSLVQGASAANSP